MKKEIVNASDVGKAAYCGHSLSLSKRQVKSHGAAVKLQQAGTREHDNLTHTVISESSGRAQDSRCYVASYAFGGDHPVTQSLRDWRDQRLLTLFGGRSLAWAYYAVSPGWVRLCRRFPPLARASKAVVMMVYRRIEGRDNSCR